ncbi:TBC1 domain family member 5-like B [Symbiodinium microadriaticum]|uniref:TBC1 domain family member 5-like B n=1 Tax=Symbiodinium microadriaticum TaxID=2951 RepID=A0A1Q9EHJ0_SYMMI|nr:TBC1 domain family member 5-like B [Symbiodinium microadriaticum]
MHVHSALPAPAAVICSEARCLWALTVYKVLSNNLPGEVGPLAAKVASYSSPEGLAACLASLGRLRQVSYVALLLSRFEDEDEDRQMRQARIEVLSFLERSPTAERHTKALASVLQREDPKLCSRAIRLLKGLGAAAAEHVAPLLGDEDARFDCIDVLQSLGSVAVPHVAPFLRHSSEDMRVVAHRLMTRLEGTPRELPREQRETPSGHKAVPQGDFKRRKLTGGEDIEYIDGIIRECVKRSRPLLDLAPAPPPDMDPPAEVEDLPPPPARVPRSRRSRPRARDHTAREQTPVAALGAPPPPPPAGPENQAPLPGPCLAQPIFGCGHLASSPSPCKQIRLDLARCFSEVPRLSCGAARTALRQVLEVHVRRSRDLRGEAPAYCQGYHELAAVMLLVCMDGSWPSDAEEVAEKLTASTRMGAVVDADDIPVYEELASQADAPADALEFRLSDMYEPRHGMRTGDEDARFDCIDVLQSLGSVAVPHVAPFLRHSSEDMRVVAHRLMTRLEGTPRELPREQRETPSGHKAVPQGDFKRRKLTGGEDIEYIDGIIRECVKRSRPLLDLAPAPPPDMDPPAEVEDLPPPPARVPRSRRSRPRARDHTAREQTPVAALGAPPPPPPAGPENQAPLPGPCLAQPIFGCGHLASSPSPCKQIRLDLARCFSEVPRLSCGAARTALRQVLEVHVRRSRDLRGEAPAYCQGYHELAAVMLLVCMDGSWPSDAEEVAEKLTASTRMGAVVDADDIPVYEELASQADAPADALALLESILYEFRLSDMYEPRHGMRTGGASAEDEEEAVVAIRCKRIITSLRRVSPDMANQIESWDMTPHVLLLRWVRLLFLRELQFPDQLLIAWDTLFADALVFYQAEGGQPPPGALPASAALPLADSLALAMIVAAAPEKPEELSRISEKALDVRRLLALACQLREFAAQTSWQSGGARSSGPVISNGFPQPPPACYPSVSGMPRPPPARPKDRRYTMGESLGGDVVGQALGWAASRLSGAFDGVFANSSDHREERPRAAAEIDRREVRRSSEPMPGRPPKSSAPPSPSLTATGGIRQLTFPAEKESPVPPQRRPSDLDDDLTAPPGDAILQPPAAPVPLVRRPRKQSEGTDARMNNPSSAAFIFFRDGMQHVACAADALDSVQHA